MEKEVPHAPLISSNQRRARSSFFFWNSCHSQINRIWEVLWEEAKCFQWSWLFPLWYMWSSIGAVVSNLSSSLIPSPGWGRVTEIVPEESVLKEWRYSASQPRISDLKVFRYLASFWLQILLPFLSSFHEMIKGEYLSDSLERERHLFSLINS